MNTPTEAPIDRHSPIHLSPSYGAPRAIETQQINTQQIGREPPPYGNPPLIDLRNAEASSGGLPGTKSSNRYGSIKREDGRLRSTETESRDQHY